MKVDERAENHESASLTPLDPVAVREALAHYRAWNEAEFVDRVRNAGKKTPAEKWREYQDLFAFARSIKPELSPGAQVLAAQEWVDYYEKLKRFEARRGSHG
jgi:hypothetical protein